VVIAASAAVIGLCQIRQTPCGPMGEAKCWQVSQLVNGICQPGHPSA